LLILLAYSVLYHTSCNSYFIT